MTRAEQELNEALRALQTGDFARAASRFERAADLLPASRATDAASALESASQLCILADDLDRAATILARAQALTPGSPRLIKLAAKLADAQGDLEARDRAWRDVVARGDAKDQVGAWVNLAEVARDRQAFAEQVAHLGRALAAAPPSDPATRADLAFELAIAQTAAGELDAAELSLEAALGMAVPEQVTMAARAQGQRGLIALRRGDLEAAMSYAEAARAGAVAHSDVLTYLGASTTIAGIHEHAGRLVDVYDTLMRTQASLGSLLGADGKALVAPAVEAFEARLGAEEFRRVWDAWVAMRRAAQAPKS